MPYIQAKISYHNHGGNKESTHIMNELKNAFVKKCSQLCNEHISIVPYVESVITAIDLKTRKEVESKKICLKRLSNSYVNRSYASGVTSWHKTNPSSWVYFPTLSQPLPRWMLDQCIIWIERNRVKNVPIDQLVREYIWWLYYFNLIC